MRKLLLLALAGVVAQLVDGSLGMAYGVTSTTVLLAAGVAPALASAAVHISEVGTTFVSGVSHTGFGNVDWSKVGWMAVPGGVGAFLGATALIYASSLETVAGYVEPTVAIFLFALGVYVLAKFSFRKKERPVEIRPVPKRFLSPLGFFAGFMDAFGGGGWGPIATPTLLSSGRMEPRKVIGTVDTSEFVIAICASIGFLLGLSFADVPWTIVGALLIGGLVAAPIAAFIVRIMPSRVMGTAVGGFILLVNAQTFLAAVGMTGTPARILYIVLALVWLAALAYAIFVMREEKTEAQAEAA